MIRMRPKKKTRKANLLEEFGGQLIDGFITLIGELFIYIIFIIFRCFTRYYLCRYFLWLGHTILLLPFAFLVYILFKNIVVNNSTTLASF